MHMVAEGVKTSKVVMELAHEYDVVMPIAREVHRVVHEGGTAVDAYRGLLARPDARCRDARDAQLLIRWRACASGPAPRASPGDDWVQARGAGRWTTVGNLDSPQRAAVDAAGLVAVAGRPWSLDWWIGAEDRWHVPAREVAVRQTLLGNSPVVETRLRVPSGDAVQRVYAASRPRRRRGPRRRGAQRHEGAVRRGARRPPLRPRAAPGPSAGSSSTAPWCASTARRRWCCRARPAAWRCPMRAGTRAAVVFAGDAEPVRAGRDPLRRRARQRRPALPARPHRDAPGCAPVVGTVPSSTPRRCRAPTRSRPAGRP